MIVRNRFQISNFKFQTVAGFTLIETLVVITVLGIITTLISASFIRSQRSGRDSARRSDMNAYRGALEQYANANGGLYPNSVSVISFTSSSCLSLAPTYVGRCAGDPRSGVGAQPDYKYQTSSDGSQINYCIWAKLEIGNYFEVCSDGRSGEVVSPPTMTL